MSLLVASCDIILCLLNSLTIATNNSNAMIERILAQLNGLTDTLAKQEARHHEEMTLLRQELELLKAKSAASPQATRTNAEGVTTEVETSSGDSSPLARTLFLT